MSARVPREVQEAAYQVLMDILDGDVPSACLDLHEDGDVCCEAWERALRVVHNRLEPLLKDKK